MIPGSSHLEPVNWRGDGQEFALLSGNMREGGMIDGQLRRVVMFPDDGHPDLASAVLISPAIGVTRSSCGIRRGCGSTRRTGRSAGSRIYAPVSATRTTTTRTTARRCRCQAGPRRDEQGGGVRVRVGPEASVTFMGAAMIWTQHSQTPIERAKRQATFQLDCDRPMTRPEPMTREGTLARIDRHRGPWDFVIVGGGATGVGVAVDAASRGYAVLLLEQSDFGKGTSSRSTKLVHGGVRYLEQGNISLVMEALQGARHPAPERAAPGHATCRSSSRTTTGGRRRSTGWA